MRCLTALFGHNYVTVTHWPMRGPGRTARQRILQRTTDMVQLIRANIARQSCSKTVGRSRSGTPRPSRLQDCWVRSPNSADRFDTNKRRNGAGSNMAGLPVNYCLSPIAVCNNRFHPQCDYRQFLPSRRTLGLRGFRVDVCLCTSLAADSADESSSAAVNIKALCRVHRRSGQWRRYAAPRSPLGIARDVMRGGLSKCWRCQGPWCASGVIHGCSEPTRCATAWCTAASLE